VLVVRRTHSIPIAELLGDLAAHLRHCGRSRIEMGANQVAPFFGVRASPRYRIGKDLLAYIQENSG
jgi:hypothetical protein